MKGGSRPKITALKKLHGSTEPINHAEPIPDGDLADDPMAGCPAHFTADQRAAWEYAVRNSPPGMLKRIDQSVLEVWCVVHCLHRAATEAQSKCGLLAQNGVQVVPSPLLAIINRTSLALMKAASELGFSPASRPRLHVAKPGARLGSNAGTKADPAAQSLDQYLASAPRPSLN
jgi:P27 family predicted phage terminase small subunit